MGTSGKLRRPRQGFTLVELLTVIVIIGILAGMISAAAIMARSAAKRAIVLSEIAQLDIALERYKTEVGEYPPDFTGLNLDNDPATVTAAEAAAKVVINRHLKKRFPQFRGGWDQVVAILATPPAKGGYGVDATKLDSASALAFWLGGLPEDASSTKLAGFHTDRANPFKPGLPRSKPYFGFSDDEKRFTYVSGGALRCQYFPEGIVEKPYVYFRPQRDPTGGQTYLFTERDPTDTTQFVFMVRTWPALSPPLSAGNSDRAVPYLETFPTSAKWHAEDRYQIISCGLDGTFGERATPTPAASNSAPTYVFPVTKTGLNFAADGGDYDNLTSVYEGKLEDTQE